MELINGIMIPTIFYYGNMIDEDGGSIDNSNEEFASSIFYSIDNISPCSYNGYKNGTLVTSSGIEYFTHFDMNSVHTKIREVKNKEYNTLLFNHN